jgi:ATPase subunit of ABC transporter with duplicated ATPase domains
LEIYIPVGERLGDIVVEAQRVGKGYDDKLLFENLEFSLPRGGIVGVIGANGAGKNDFVSPDYRNRKRPTKGDFRVGENVKLGYVDQSREFAKPRQNNLGRNLRRT